MHPRRVVLLLFLAGVAALPLPARAAASTENPVARMRPMLGTLILALHALLGWKDRDRD